MPLGLPLQVRARRDFVWLFRGCFVFLALVFGVGPQFDDNPRVRVLLAWVTSLLLAGWAWTEYVLARARLRLLEASLDRRGPLRTTSVPLTEVRGWRLRGDAPWGPDDLELHAASRAWRVPVAALDPGGLSRILEALEAQGIQPAGDRSSIRASRRRVASLLGVLLPLTATSLVLLWGALGDQPWSGVGPGRLPAAILFAGGCVAATLHVAVSARRSMITVGDDSLVVCTAWRRPRSIALAGLWTVGARRAGRPRSRGHIRELRLNWRDGKRRRVKTWIYAHTDVVGIARTLENRAR